MSLQQLPSWIGFWLINILVLYLASLVSPQAVVLGNANLSPLAAAIISGFLLTLGVIATKPVVKLLGISIKIKKEKQLVFVYWIANGIALWIIARLAIYTGFGITGFWWAIILGLIATLLQWGVWKLFSPRTKKNKS